MKMTLVCFHLPGKKRNLNIPVIIPTGGLLPSPQRMQATRRPDSRDKHSHENDKEREAFILSVSYRHFAPGTRSRAFIDIIKIS